jgi:hypothetical protein
MCSERMNVTAACRDPERAAFGRLMLSVVGSSPPRLSIQLQRRSDLIVKAGCRDPTPRFHNLAHPDIDEACEQPSC